MARVKISGVGPFYWAREDDADGKNIDIAWMAETAPPFRVGKALRIRNGRRALHFGVCRKSKRPVVREVEKSAEEIGKWVFD